MNLKSILTSSALALALLTPCKLNSSQIEFNYFSAQTIPVFSLYTPSPPKDGLYDDDLRFVYDFSSELAEIRESIELIKILQEYEVRPKEKKQEKEKKPEERQVESPKLQNFLFGTVFVYKITEKGVYVITAGHVLEESGPKDLEEIIPEEFEMILTKNEISIEKNSEKLEGKIVVLDRGSDLGILFFSEKDRFTECPAPLGDSDLLRIGDLIYHIGYQLGIPMIGQGYIRNEKGPATDEEIQILKGSKEDFFFFSSDVNIGDSGAPIIALRDGEAEIVGIVEAIVPKNPYNSEAVYGLDVGRKINSIKRNLDAYIDFYEEYGQTYQTAEPVLSAPAGN